MQPFITGTRNLEKENTELKKMFAEMSIENRALNNLIEKSCNPQEKREAVDYLTTDKHFNAGDGD